MTARPQQMSDGQEKSDDLIAELAKLMASTAGGSEAEAKPAPKLVSDAPRSVAPTIRIPGMDAPVPATPAAAPVQPAAIDRPVPTVVRVPGMDQTVAAAPAPVRIPGAPVPATPAASATPVAPVAETKPVETRPAASFDFGTLPPTSSLKPEPLSNWQDREIPKPVPVRPAAVEPLAPPATPAVLAETRSFDSKPVENRPAEFRPATPASDLHPAAPVVEAAPPRQEPSFEAPRPVASSPSDQPVATAKPAPAGDSFDFDFGFSADAPPPPLVESRPAPRPVAPRISSGDPIADLIAADLDADMDGEPPATPTPVIVRPAVQAPVVRAAAPAMAPAPQRPVASTPVRPPLATPVASAPVHKPAEERFAPVFGVGSRSTTQQPELDPMDEIESLIGEAVRVELSAPERPAAPVAPAPAPVVPPLTTNFAPRRAAIKDTDTQVSSAEAAILAAAAASGAEVGRMDGGMIAEASPYKRPRAKPGRRTLFSGGMRQYVGMAVAGTLLLAAGLGLYWVLGMGRGNDADAPVLSADATPVKETPPAPAAAATDAQGSVVFNELDGNAAAPIDEQLVSRDDSAETSVADVARTVGEDGGEATSESELANRKVRTVTVRPDGTIVSGDDAVAGSEALPVDRPNVPDLPGADVQPSELLAAVPTDDVATDATAAVAATTDPAVGTDGALTALVEPSPAAIIDPSIVAPVPAARPSDRSVLGGGSNQQVAAVDSAAPLDLAPAGGNDAPAEAAPVAAAGGAYVQLSSQRTEGDAQASLRTTQNRLSGLLNGQSLAIRRVDLGAKGVWYRVVLPTGSFQQATQACASFKANGTDCVAING